MTGYIHMYDLEDSIMLYFFTHSSYNSFGKYMIRRGYCIFLMLCLAITLEGCSFSFLSDFYPQSEDTISIRRETESSAQEESSISEERIYVHVCGCVRTPGLYALKQGQRIDAAIQAAGGFTKDAQESSVNLAELLVDGTQIEVAAKSVDEDASAKDSTDGKVNLNTADQTQLMTLSGIGESRAKAILSYREEHGSFSSIEDLKNVDGIGDGIYQKIKNEIKT